MIHLDDNEKIVAVVPEVSNGQGWVSSVFNVYVMDRNSCIRNETIPYNEASYDMKTLFNIAIAAHDTMLSQTKKWVTKSQDM